MVGNPLGREVSGPAACGLSRPQTRGEMMAAVMPQILAEINDEPMAFVTPPPTPEQALFARIRQLTAQGLEAFVSGTPDRETAALLAASSDSWVMARHVAAELLERLHQAAQIAAGETAVDQIVSLPQHEPGVALTEKAILEVRQRLTGSQDLGVYRLMPYKPDWGSADTPTHIIHASPYNPADLPPIWTEAT